MEVAPDDLDPEELHPLNYPKGAAWLQNELFWDECDDHSPLGNDTGHDVFYSYLNWRQEHPRANPLKFLENLMDRWGVANEGWELIQGEEVAPVLEADKYSFLSRDDMIIALAFAEIVLNGNVHPEVHRRARLAVERQLLPEVLSVRMGMGSPWERIEKFEKMRKVLERDAPMPL